MYPEFIPNLIGGQFREAATGRQLPVFNPDTGKSISGVARSAAEDVAEGVASAKTAQPMWRNQTGVYRGEVLHGICNALEDAADELSELIAIEAGKKIEDALGETRAAIQCGRFFAGEGQRMFGKTMPSGVAGRWAMTVRRPCGIAGLITAANTPAPNFAWKVFPALICGNSVVLKPSEETPASAWFMAKVAQEAGLPVGVLNVVNGTGQETGAPLAEHPDINVVSFTGSSHVGRLIASAAGEQLKKVSLELGGKNPFIVCDDADLDKAVHWACLAAFSNAGQRCAAASRFLVFEGVYEEFTKKFSEAAKALKLGISEKDDIGPVISQKQLSRMSTAVASCKQRGARVLIGGEASSRAGFYMMPTLLEVEDPKDPILEDELFGPVATISRVRDFSEALFVANSSTYGLTSCIHTKDIDRALSFAARVESGVVVVNGGTHGSEPHMPFGGLKFSGNGTREPGTEALEVYSELQDVYLNAGEV